MSDDMLDFLCALSTIVLRVRESVGHVRESVGIEWQVARWENGKVLVIVQYDEAVEQYAYRTVYRSGEEGPIRYMDQDEASYRIRSNASDFRWLRDSEMPEGKDRVRTSVPRKKLLEVSLFIPPIWREPIDLSHLEF